MSKSQTTSTHLGTGKQVRTYEATPSNADPTASKIKLKHEWGTCYLVVYPHKQNSLAVLAFDGMNPNWDSISSHIDELHLPAGYRLFLVTMTVNSLKLRINLNRMSEKKMWMTRSAYNVNDDPPKDGRSVAFELQEHGEKLFLDFGGKRHISTIS